MAEILSDGYRAEQHYAELFAHLRAANALIEELVGALDAANKLLGLVDASTVGKPFVRHTHDEISTALTHAREQMPSPTGEPDDAR